MSRNAIPWFLRSALGGCLLLTAAAAALAPAQQTGEGDQLERPEVVDLQFHGVRSVNEADLRRSISTQESRCRSMLLTPFCLVTTSPYFVEKHWLDRDELERDLLRIRVFYYMRGFREARVDTVLTPRADDKVAVHFTIAEGEPTLVQVLRVLQDNEVLPPRIIERNMRLRAGQPLDLLRLDSSRVALRNALWERGYSDAVFDTVIQIDRAQRTAAVELRIESRWQARVGPVVIDGNERVAARTIYNSLTFKEGDLYRRSDLIRSQRNLYESGLFQHAAIVVPPRGDTVKFVEVDVREAALQEVRLGAGFTSVQFAQLDGRYTNYNWLGRARRLEIRGTLANLLSRQLNNSWAFRDIDDAADRAFYLPTWQASAEIRQPWFLSARNTLSATTFAHRRSAPNVFIDRGYGAQTAFTREVSDRMPASATYRFEIARVEASDVYFCVSFGVCDPATIDRLQLRHRLSPLGLAFNADRSDDPFNPSRGWRGRIDTEHAATYTASDFQYTRATMEGILYRPFKGGVLAARIRAGRLFGGQTTVDLDDPESQRLVHPRKRYYAGGSNSVRGYGENQLGPRVLTIAPEQLARIGCATTFPEIISCDPNVVLEDSEGGRTWLEDGDFRAQPTGGNSVIEGSVEYRMSLWGPLSGAVFLDGALVGEGRAFGDIATGSAAITPGFGVRYQSPVGPIRVDIGVNPCVAEALPVVTEVRDADGRQEIVMLGLENGELDRSKRRVYAPACRAAGVSGALQRLRLHLSIGQAF